MTIVTGGFGLPEEGSLVTSGLGATEPANPGSISASLTGTSTLAGTLTYPENTPGVTFGGGAGRPLRTVAPLTANLSGTSSLTADLTFEVTPLAWQQLEALLILELV